MRPKLISLTSLAAADRNGVCAAQTPTGAGNMTIAGALASGGVATMDYARHITIYSDGDDSGVTFTITGTNRNGDAKTETITGPDSTTVTSTGNFKTITQVAISDAGTGSIEVGTGTTLQTAPVPVDVYRGGISYRVDLTNAGGSSSLTVTSQFTLDDVLKSTFDEDTADWITDENAKTSDFEGSTTVPIRALRLSVSGIEASDAINFTILQQAV